MLAENECEPFARNANVVASPIEGERGFALRTSRDPPRPRIESRKGFSAACR